MYHKFKQFSVLLAFIFVFAFVSLAQNDSFGLSGKVTDSSGAVISNAAVKVRNLVTGEEITTQTDNDGVFRIKTLPKGKYRIIVESNGFSSGISEVTAEENAGITKDFVLAIGNVSETVTVTATRTQVATTDTAVPVSVVDRRQIERENVNTIGDVFRKLPGTSTVNEGAFQVRPRIRGLDSNRVLVLVDGERLNNARTSTTQSGIELGLVGTEQIETLEVVRGSGSVLYGTDALGGTINIITKDAPRKNEDGFRFGGTFNGYLSSNENGYRGSLALKGSSKYFSFRVAQSLERYGNYFTGDTSTVNFTPQSIGITPEGEVLNSQSNGSNTQVTTRFFFNDNNDLRLNYERRRAANIGSPTLTPEFGFNAFFPFSNRDKFNGRFETRNVNSNLLKVSASFYYQNQNRNFSNILVVPAVPPFFPGLNNFSETITDTDSYGLDVQTNWLFGTRNFLTAGFSFFRDENQDSRFEERRIPVVTRDRTQSVPDANFGSFAGFVQDQYDVTNRLRLIGGVRVERFTSASKPTNGFAVDPNLSQQQLEDLGIVDLENGLDVKETAVTGDFGAVYKVTEEISLTGRIGRSFRVANLFERFFTGSGSIGGYVVANPTLEPESGINFDTSVKFRNSKFAGSVTYFNNYYRNFLSNQLAFDRNGDPITLPGGQRPIEVFQTVNIDRARIQGFEADFEIPIRIGIGFLTPSGNLSYLRGDNVSDDEPLNTITPLKTVLNLRWQNLQSNYYADWTTRIVKKQDRLSDSFLVSNQGAEPGFVVSDIGGGYTFRKNDRYRLSFNVGVKNVFDRLYSEQFVFAPARGRSFVFGTTLDLN